MLSLVVNFSGCEAGHKIGKLAVVDKILIVWAYCCRSRGSVFLSHMVSPLSNLYIQSLTIM